MSWAEYLEVYVVVAIAIYSWCWFVEGVYDLTRGVDMPEIVVRNLLLITILWPLALIAIIMKSIGTMVGTIIIKLMK